MKTPINDGGPAFPSEHGGTKSGGYGIPHACPTPGLSLRDYFAAKAMQGILAGWSIPDDEVAKAAYQQAGFMIAARTLNLAPGRDSK